MDMMDKQMMNLIIIENSHISDNYFILKCSSEKPFQKISAGQFAHIRIDNNPNVFLRRPFSIHNYENNTISFLIKAVGEGSTSLSKLKQNDIINAVLPLGKGFSVSKALSGKSLLIGGGVGIAPIYLLAKQINAAKADINVLIGGKTDRDLLCIDNFNDLCTTFFTTEDGSKGCKGFVTNHKCINEDINQYANIFCCGPEPMMKAIASIARKNSIFCEVSLENKMACGIGACLCCVTETKHGNQCVCTNGPVFNINELVW